MHLLKLPGQRPQVHPSVYRAPNSVIVGDVTIGEGSSVWYNAVIRGDVAPIVIGARTNLQDGVVVHGSTGGPAVEIGDDVTVGHSAIVHGAKIEGHTIIGMAAVILDGAVIEPDCLIGASSLVTQGVRIPRGSLVLGSPARVVRQLTEEEIATLTLSAESYIRAAASHSQAEDINGK